MVSQTVQALANAVAQELIVGDTFDTTSANAFIDRLQRLIDGMSIQRPLVFTERMDLITLTANQQSYTIGIDPTSSNTANFAIPRPTKIVAANLLLTSTVRKPVRPIELEEWKKIRYQQVYGPPRKLYFDGGYQSATTSGTSMTGFGQLFFYLIPDSNYQLELYTWQQLQQITALADLINYPPGYADFLLYAMVVRCASMFGRDATQTQIEMYKEARAAVEASNAQSPLLAPGDAGRMGGGDNAGLYNWLAGEIED